MAEYLFDGNANDTSGNGYSGNDENVNYSIDPSFSQTKKVAIFDGTNSYINIPQIPASSDIAVSTWVKINADNGSSV